MTQALKKGEIIVSMCWLFAPKLPKLLFLQK